VEGAEPLEMRRQVAFNPLTEVLNHLTERRDKLRDNSLQMKQCMTVTVCEYMTDLEVLNYCNRMAQFFSTFALGAIIPGTLSK